MFSQYQQIELLKDLNPVIRKGMIGVILEIWDENNFEVEFVQEDGSTMSLMVMAPSLLIQISSALRKWIPAIEKLTVAVAVAVFPSSCFEH